MVYALAVEHLDDDGRAELDAALEVASWPAAGETPAQTAARAEAGDGTPSWWQGEEEASASWLASMGIDLAQLDRRGGESAP